MGRILATEVSTDSEVAKATEVAVGWVEKVCAGPMAEP